MGKKESCKPRETGGSVPVGTLVKISKIIGIHRESYTDLGYQLQRYIGACVHACTHAHPHTHVHTHTHGKGDDCSP